jgi:2-keto-4-pentenoate hydratase
MAEEKTARQRVEAAATLLADAWRTHKRLEALPEAVRPLTLEEAHAVQDATLEKLGEAAGGWKAGVNRPIRGAVMASRLLASPASLSTALMLRRVVEGEIAFRFNRDLPPADRDYTREEVAAAVSLCPAIEVVDSRYEDQASRPELERVADLFGNSALVCGEPIDDWQRLDLANIHVRLLIDGVPAIDRRGGHATGDPLHACVLLVNDLRRSSGVRAGQVVTAGTYTGAPSMMPGSEAVVEFEGVGRAAVRFTA